MKIQVIDETQLPAADLARIIAGIKYFAPLVTKAWKLPDVEITTDTGDWKIYITERNRQVGALGFHKMENGVPVAYISRRAAYRLYGSYSAPFILRGKQINGARYSEGLITVICHELAEMLCDPAIKNYSALDSQGRAWLIEVCDHVAGVYHVEQIGGVNCVFPDVTTPAFYDVNGKIPLSIYGGATAPFTLKGKAYGYYKASNGALVKL